MTAQGVNENIENVEPWGTLLVVQLAHPHRTKDKCYHHSNS